MRLWIVAALVAGCADAEALAPRGAETAAVPAPLSVVTVSTPPGAWLGQQVLTGTGIYVPTPGTTAVRVRQQAAGGGGGGVGAGGFGVGCGGGGNSGFYLDYTIPLISGGAFSAGTGGAGGTSAPTAGGTGGDATIVLNGTTYIAKGGTGGTPGIKASSGVTGPNLPQQGSTGMPAVPIVTYGEGGLGFWSGTTAAASGRGGSSPFGAGGVAVGVGSGGIAGVRGGGGSGGATTTAIVGGPGGDGIILIDEYTSTSTAPTPSGTCSAAALDTPRAQFVATVGQPIALLASATCAPGVTPEFQYWGTDINLNAVALTGFIAGSSSFTPSAAGALCFSAVARAVGSSDTVRSAWSCGTASVATGGTPAPGSVTASVPLHGATNDSAFPARFLATNSLGQGVDVQLPPIPVGATITNVSFRVQDSAIGPTKLYAEVTDQDDLTFVATAGSDQQQTTGTGEFQTLSVPTSMIVKPLHIYHAGVFVKTGTAPCKVTAIDVTYTP